MLKTLRQDWLSNARNDLLAGLAGILQIIAGWLRLATLMRFVSRSASIRTLLTR
jgi:hypothetical protein